MCPQKTEKMSERAMGGRQRTFVRDDVLATRRHLRGVVVQWRHRECGQQLVTGAQDCHVQIQPTPSRATARRHSKLMMGDKTINRDLKCIDDTCGCLFSLPCPRGVRPSGPAALFLAGQKQVNGIPHPCAPRPRRRRLALLINCTWPQNRASFERLFCSASRVC